MPKGERFYQVDARRKGTDGKRETFPTQQAAEKRAAEIAEEFNLNGREGLSLNLELRAGALQGRRILEPYGKTVLQACEFYRAHLEAERQRLASYTIESLADEWYEFKASGRERELRKETLRGIRYGRNLLKEVFRGKRILEISTVEIRSYLDGLKVSKLRKHNINSRWSQFFNWAIANGYVSENPCALVKIHANLKKVATFTPADAQRLMTICETKFPEMTLFFALALFAGLRPDNESEAQNLVWEDVDLESRTIFIHAEKTKVKEDRSVPIEENLLHWLTAYRPKNPKGLVTVGTNFKKRRQAVHVAMGYQAQGKNADASSWPQDITRHSYCSYSLAMGLTKGQVAENSGNSPKIIKKHYKKVLPKSAALAYWGIVPATIAAQRAEELGKEAELTDVQEGSVEPYDFDSCFENFEEGVA